MPDLGCINFVNMVNYLSPGAGFHPSSVCSWWTYPTVERALFFVPEPFTQQMSIQFLFSWYFHFWRSLDLFWKSCEIISPLQAESLIFWSHSCGKILIEICFGDSRQPNSHKLHTQTLQGYQLSAPVSAFGGEGIPISHPWRIQVTNLGKAPAVAVHFNQLGKPLKSSQKPSCPPKKRVPFLHFLLFMVQKSG